MKNPQATKLANEYAAKYPDKPTGFIARLMSKNHPKIFSFKNAESAIRYRRGAIGDKHRAQVPVKAVKAFSNVTPASKFNPLNPLELPETQAVDLVPFAMEGCERVLVLPDLHIPYHNIESLTIALQTGQKRKADSVLINGDLLDFHMISRFEHDPDARTPKQERKSAKDFLIRLRGLFPKARIIFKEGNHDARLRSYLVDRAPLVYDEDIMGMVAFLGLDNVGVEYVIDKRIVMVGDLPVLHGHELPRGISAPVNPARGAYMRAKVSCLVSHSHRTSEHTETKMNRKIVTCWSTGGLCHLQPQYDPYNGWNAGFAFIEVANGGNYNVSNYRIYNGKLLN